MDIGAVVGVQNLSLVVAVMGITQAAKRSFKNFFLNHVVGKILLPWLPLLLGIPTAFIGATATRWQDKLILGFVVGFAAGHLFKVGQKTFLSWGGSGSDRPTSVPEEPKSSTSSTPPSEPPPAA